MLNSMHRWVLDSGRGYIGAGEGITAIRWLYSHSIVAGEQLDRDKRGLKILDCDW